MREINRLVGSGGIVHSITLIPLPMLSRTIRPPVPSSECFAFRPSPAPVRMQKSMSAPTTCEQVFILWCSCPCRVIVLLSSESRFLDRCRRTPISPSPFDFTPNLFPTPTPPPPHTYIHTHVLTCAPADEHASSSDPDPQYGSST